MGLRPNCDNKRDLSSLIPWPSIIPPPTTNRPTVAISTSRMAKRDLELTHVIHPLNWHNCPYVSHPKFPIFRNRKTGTRLEPRCPSRHTELAPPESSQLPERWDGSQKARFYNLQQWNKTMTPPSLDSGTHGEAGSLVMVETSHESKQTAKKQRLR
jgi:hypothetical protein